MGLDSDSERRDALLLLCACAEAIEGAAPRQNHQPSRRRSSPRIVTFRLAPYLGVHIQRHLFSRGRIAHDTQGKTIDKWAAGIVEGAKRLLVALCDPIHEHRPVVCLRALLKGG